MLKWIPKNNCTYNISCSTARFGSGTVINGFKCDHCKSFFLIDLDGGVCQRDLNEGQFTYINYELSCCGGGVMLCFAVSIVLK